MELGGTGDEVRIKEINDNGTGIVDEGEINSGAVITIPNGTGNPSVISNASQKFQAKAWPQYVFSLTATIGSFGLGTVLGWASPGLPDIEERGAFDGLKATSETASWIVALMPLGGTFTGFGAGFLVDRIGRKNTMMASAIPFCGAWLMIAFAPNVIWVLIGRFITGFCGGAFTLCIPVYVSEIAEDKHRGVLCNLLVLVLCLGLLWAYVLGSLVSWDTACLAHACVPVIFAIAMFFAPQSPYYLIQKGKRAEARKALRCLRGAPEEKMIDPELKQIESRLSEYQSVSATWRDLCVGPVLKPTGICIMLMFLQQFGGINAVLFYSVDIFRSAGTPVNANVSAIIVAAVQVVFVVVSTLLLNRLGRKTLLIISEGGMAISLIALGIYFYLKEGDMEMTGVTKNLAWLPLCSLILYIITYNLAMGPMPWTMMGELLPAHVKAFTSSFATAFSWGLGFLVTKFFTTGLDILGPAGCYWFFSGFAILGIILCLFLVPETKGKSFEEIQQYFGGGMKMSAAGAEAATILNQVHHAPIGQPLPLESA